MSKVYNFSPGPALLPAEVMEEAQREFLDYKGTGMSILEVSHRSDIFQEVIDDAEDRLRQVMHIPNNYKVLFLQGGASSQFSMVPLNLMQKGKADFLDTGAWSKKAIAEANRYGKSRVVASSSDQNYSYIPSTTLGDFDPDADYLHLTTNNTIFGTRLPEIPGLDHVVRVADMSSNILAEDYKVEDFGLIYAGAQKNMGPSGLTLVIVREDLIGKAMDICPKMLNYQTHTEKSSLFNTPPTFSIYLTSKVLKWVQEKGGVKVMEGISIARSKMLYDFLDDSPFYQANIQAPFRSRMNVCFRTPSAEKDLALVDFAQQRGLMFLKGHRSVGGLRASLYNAMSQIGVAKLLEVLEEFEKHS